MAYIGRPEITVDRHRTVECWLDCASQLPDMDEEVIQRSAVAHGNVENLINGVGILRRSREQIGLDGIGDVAKVTAGFAVTIDVNRLTAQ